jgi:crotonobetainyl-CoA:carnitine CoA-transferase CaiB-like acyl-CoA transferase
MGWAAAPGLAGFRNKATEPDGRHSTQPERFAAANVPHAEVQDYAAVFASEQAAARGLRVTVRDPDGRPVDLVGTPVKVAGATLPPPACPPRPGRHTAEVLGELLGLDAAEVERLRERGVV